MELKLGLKISFIIDFVLGCLVGVFLLFLPVKVTEWFNLGIIDSILLRLIGSFSLGLGSASLIAAIRNSQMVADLIMYFHLIWLIPASGVIVYWIITNGALIIWFILTIFVIYIALFIYYILIHRKENN